MPRNPFKSPEAAPQWPADGEANGRSNGKALAEPLIPKHGRVTGFRLWLQQVRPFAVRVRACVLCCGKLAAS
jgi:hypothetical protein